MQAVPTSEVFTYSRKKLLAIAHFERFVLVFSVLAFSVAPDGQPFRPIGLHDSPLACHLARFVGATVYCCIELIRNLRLK